MSYSLYALQASPDHASRIEGGQGASTSGRMGVPTKVMLHKKSSKQYTNLAVVQELYAHTGELVGRQAGELSNVIPKREP